jgi:hypothetical protein
VNANLERPRDRASAILNCPEATGNEAVAEFLVQANTVSVDEAIGVLAFINQNRQAQIDAMWSEVIEKISPDVSTAH